MWSVSLSVAEAEADKIPFRGALARRLGCATVAVSSGRLAVLSVPVVVAAGCSTLLEDLEASGGSAGSADLLALAPVLAARSLLRSLLPAAMTASCSSAINVESGRSIFSPYAARSMKNKEERHLLASVSACWRAPQLLHTNVEVLVNSMPHLAPSATDSLPRWR